MTTLTLILSAGSRDVEQFGHVKCLLRVGGQTLAERTISKVILRSARVVMLIRGPHLLVSCQQIQTARDCGSSDTILEVREMWNEYDRVVVLLGDVWYTDEAIGTIYEPSHRIRFFTDGLEIFALAFPREHYAVVDAHAREVVRKAHGNSQRGGNPRLWESLHIAKQPVEKIWIKDETQDFDCPSQYLGFLRGERKNRFLAT